MGNTNLRNINHCAFCENKTSPCQYSFKYKKNICKDCSNYIFACSHCNEWYTKGLIRYNEKLFCVDCLNNLSDTTQICILCKKKHTHTVTHTNKIYCIVCITNLSKLYNKKIL
jgi:hypothetical protein